MFGFYRKFAFSATPIFRSIGRLGQKTNGRTFFIGSTLLNKPINVDPASLQQPGVKPERKPHEVELPTRENMNLKYAYTHFDLICVHLGMDNDKLGRQNFIDLCHCIHLLPRTAISLKKWPEFFDKHFENWWAKLTSLLGPNYLLPVKRSIILRQLYELDCLTDGGVVKKLTWPNIKRVLIKPQFNRGEVLHVKGFELLFFNLSFFARDKKYEQIFRDEYSKELSKIFWQNFKFYYDTLKHRPFLKHSLGKLMRTGQACHFDFPVSNFNMPNFIDFCLSSCTLITEVRNASEHYRLENCAAIGEAFSKFGLNIDQYSSNFWPTWYQLMIQTYKKSVDENPAPKNPQYNAHLLNLCLEIALKLEKFKEFDEIKDDWIENMQQLIDFLKEEERFAMINLLNKRINEKICTELLPLYKKL